MISLFLFSKGCPNPSFPLCAATAAPAQAATALARWQPPCHGAATPADGTTAPVGGRAGRGRPTAGPLFGCRAVSDYANERLSPLRAGRSRSCPRAALLATSAAPVGCCPCMRLPPLAGTAGLPVGLAPATASRPLAGDLGRGLAVGGRPYMGLVVAGRPSSSLPSLRKHSRNA
ncbi:hypothetical protein GW17_00033411 [Ensete ventricosum]|nr:hypothetical protein GW17_00033411 [Ensete ventricosum]